MAARYFALLIGIALVLADEVNHDLLADTNSILPETNGLLLGLFPINAVHNLVHLSFGIWGL